jgi:predicted phage baseplate assembly protein
MSGAIDPSLRGLNDCGCCEGIEAQTPADVYNRPGLNAIAYRVGTYAQFKQSLLASISASNHPALRGLTTRENSDFAIAFLDACAIGADILTFYSERQINEAYLRTATERLSLLELARLIGYELRPGVAASTYLAFTVEDAPGSLRKATIDIGSKVQSVPGPGEQPQTFETVEKIEARAEWNVIKPRLTQRHPIQENAVRLLFEGLSTVLKPGDGLLLIPDNGSQPVFRQVTEVLLQTAQQRTEVRLQGIASRGRFSVFVGGGGLAARAVSSVTSKFLNLGTTSATNLATQAQIQNFRVSEIFANLSATRPSPPSVFVFRARAAIFGHNAPRWESLPNTQRFGEYVSKRRTPTAGNSAEIEFVYQDGPYSGRDTSWVENTLDKYHNESGPNLYLDNVYSSITKESWVVLKDGSTSKAYQVEEVVELSKSDFALNAKTTRLTLKNRDDFGNFGIRTTTVFAQSEELKLARLPIETPVLGSEIELDSAVESLVIGQAIILCGELHQNQGNYACEQATLTRVDYVFRDNEGFTKLTLSKGLGNEYVRSTVTINANVVLATHGETVQEVLGSGNGNQSYQKFTLRQPPLTFVSASTPSGTASTLQMRVNDLLWHEVPTLYGKGAQERVYVTRTNDEGKTALVFNGHLPTGQENVKATYRKGIGIGGLVEAGQLSLLMTRPLGVKGVTNPQASEGAEDPEDLAQARRNAPLTILTLDRIVSLQDYEDFARAFAGIGKALATWNWNGQQQGVFVTVAGPNGAFVEASSELYKNLVAAMQKAGDRYISLQVKSYRRAYFRIKAGVKIDPDYLPEKVIAAVWNSLQTQFSFDARGFGQSVALSEAIAIIQTIPGVKAVDVDKFYRFGETENWQPRLTSAAPQVGAGGAVAAAELLLLDPNSPLDDLRVMT